MAETKTIQRYTAKNLAEVAAYFRTLANDQIGCKRFQSTQKAKVECDIKASVWTDAAEMLNNLDLTG